VKTVLNILRVLKVKHCHLGVIQKLSLTLSLFSRKYSIDKNNINAFVDLSEIDIQTVLDQISMYR